MDGHAHQPLSPAEAKDQLRLIAQEMGLAKWVQRQPLSAVLVALLSGFAIGRLPRLWSTLTRSPMGRHVGESLFKRLG